MWNAADEENDILGGTSPDLPGMGLKSLTDKQAPSWIPCTNMVKNCSSARATWACSRARAALVALVAVGGREEPDLRR